MKNVILFFVCMLSLSVSAQVVVEDDGNVGIGLIPINDYFQSEFSVNTVGSLKVCFYIKVDRSDCSVGIRINKQGTMSLSDDPIGLMSVNYMNPERKNFGVYAQSYSSQGDLGSGRSYG